MPTAATSPTAPTANSGFDFLRDNMKGSAAQQVQGPLQYVIVDEVDSILIDEARTPLIISGAAHDDAAKYRASDVVARKVMELHKPYAVVDAAVDAAKRAIKTAEGDEDKAKNSAEKEAAKKTAGAVQAAACRGREAQGGGHAILRGGAGSQERAPDARGDRRGAGRGGGGIVFMSATTWNGRI